MEAGAEGGCKAAKAEIKIDEAERAKLSGAD
jgi:hypothetical protein